MDRATGELAHRVFADILEYLRPGDLLVGNNSRVIPARLHGVKETGGAVEIFLLRPAHAEAARARTRGAQDVLLRRALAWECLVGGKGLRPGVRVRLQHPSTALRSAQDDPRGNPERSTLSGATEGSEVEGAEWRVDHAS